METVLRRVRSAEPASKEIIVVDDCSTDSSWELLQGTLNGLADVTIRHEVNQGKGAALRTGFASATGEVVIVQDADLEYLPEEFVSVISPVLAGDADVCYGSRFAKGKRKGYTANIIANLVLTKLSNVFTGFKITDMETCYKSFRRDIIQSIIIEENRFGIEPEVTAKLSKLGVRITEIPISYLPRSAEEGKKINWKDGVRALYCIVFYGGASKVGQLLTYGVIGGSAALIEWATFWLCNFPANLGIYWSTAIAFVLATGWNWFLGRKTLFRDRKFRSDIAPVFLVSGIGLAFDLGLMHLFVPVFRWPAMLSKILATGIVFFWNFLSRKLLIYRHHN